MRRYITHLMLFLFAMLWIGFGPDNTDASSYDMIPRITIDKLKDKLNDQSLIVLDVRLPAHLEASSYKIPGAVWVNPASVDNWSQFFAKDSTFVLY